MRKTMSSKQLAANRRNAQQSTGPRTATGRAVSKMNAVKHGILSKEVLVRGLNIKENPREFAALHQRFVESLQPVGPVEEMLVDQIVTAHWRLRRALSAESGEIALSVDEGQWERNRPPNPLLLWNRWDLQCDVIYAMEQSQWGIGVLQTHLEELRQGVERDGELTEAAIQLLTKRLGDRTTRLARELKEFRSRLLERPAGLAGEALKARNRAETLAFLNAKLRQLEWQEAECAKRESHHEQARQAADVLPSAETLEKIQRYETKLERQMYRAMNQLERLQRMRQGEAIPAPLTMEVTERP